MSKKHGSNKEASQVAKEGAELATDGGGTVGGLWDDAVYLGKDGFVYHIEAERSGGRTELRIKSKRNVGEYLRWADGLFRQGELPSESTGIHYRAARKLRELI